MSTHKTQVVSIAEAKALKGDYIAMEFLARRFFDGKGVQQSFQESFYWSSLATSYGVKYLQSMSQFAFKKLTIEEAARVNSKIQNWHDQLSPL
ncbi:MAG: hypothetical protein PSN46_08055 [Gammaproteobacteria bacterium]|nr:hypothetical protein [Gammaproteobacteria bacterium]